MSVNKATFGAIAFSGATLLACLFAISAIYSDVQSIWTELDTEMDSFKVIADDLWKDMLIMGAGTPSNRQRRQAYGGYGASQPIPNSVSDNFKLIHPPIGQAPNFPSNNAAGFPNGPHFSSGSNSNCRMFYFIHFYKNKN